MGDQTRILTTPDGDRLLSCPDGRSLSIPGDPACCGDCPLWLQFEPCGTFSCAGDEQPGSGGFVWLCLTAFCTNIFDGDGIPINVVGDRPGVVVVIGGACYKPTGVQVQDIAQIPPGQNIIQDLAFECELGCGACQPVTGWARAIPCRASDPPLYFCRSTVPFCVVMVPPPALLGPGCPAYTGNYIFNPTRPVVTPPDGACRIVFPPTFNFNGIARNCCEAGVPTNDCTRITSLPSYDQFCGTPFPGGCCGDTTNAVARHTGRQHLELWFNPGGGQFGNPYRVESVDVRWDSTSVAGGTYIRTTQQYNENGTPSGPPNTQTLTIQPYATICPVELLPPLPGAFDFIGTRCPQTCNGTTTPATEFRTTDRWTWVYNRNCQAEVGGSEYNINRTTITAQLLNMDMGPCGNRNCAGSFSPQPRPGQPIDGVPGLPAPAEGTDGGTITLRGGGSRPIDPATAAILEQQSRGGGCRSCGEGWVGG